MSELEINLLGKEYFTATEAAARAYDEAAVEHFGRFAKLNFPEEYGREAG